MKMAPSLEECISRAKDIYETPTMVSDVKAEDFLQHFSSDYIFSYFADLQSFNAYY